MMDDEFDELLSEDAFWDGLSTSPSSPTSLTLGSAELDDIASTPCRSHDRIDDTLRTWIGIITRHRG